MSPYRESARPLAPVVTRPDDRFGALFWLAFFLVGTLAIALR